MHLTEHCIIFSILHSKIMAKSASARVIYLPLQLFNVCNKTLTPHLTVHLILLCNKTLTPHLTVHLILLLRTCVKLALNINIYIIYIYIYVYGHQESVYPALLYIWVINE